MKKIILASIVAAGVAFAGNTNTGCGLGSVIIGEQDTLAKQVVAATTNNTFGNQTFGITTGTLGCRKPMNIVSNDVFKFVNENVDSLALDISNGNGETLNTLASMLNVQDKDAFAKKLQANFAKIFPSSNVDTAHVIDAITSLS